MTNYNEDMYLMNLTTKQVLLTTAVLAFMTLPLPFVWLEIGPMGKEYYGPNVPDIYILGATILGKDRGFWGINFAYKLQLLVIIYFMFAALWTIKVLNRRKFALTLTTVNLLLLILFPFWLYIYTDGVLSNSDGATADIKPHFGIGLLLYIFLLLLNLLAFKKIKNASS